MTFSVAPRSAQVTGTARDKVGGKSLKFLGGRYDMI